MCKHLSKRPLIQKSVQINLYHREELSYRATFLLPFDGDLFDWNLSAGKHVHIKLVHLPRVYYIVLFQNVLVKLIVKRNTYELLLLLKFFSQK